MRYEAIYYDGLTARAQPVSIAVTDSGIVISAVTGAVLAHWPADLVILAERPRDRESVRIGLEGTTARLIVDDSGVLEMLGPVAPRLYRRVRLSWRGLVRIVAWTGASAGSIAFILFVAVPSLSKQMAAATPDTIRLRIGGTALRQLSRILPIDRDGPRPTRGTYCGEYSGRYAIEVMMERLTADMGEAPSLRVVVLNTKVVNAFALPGNIIVLTKGLIDEALNAEELAGVIAHELGHIVHDHPTQGMYRTATVSVLVALVVGDVAGAIPGLSLGHRALNSGYSRLAEREADRYGLERLYSAGIDAGGLEGFLARLLKKRAKDGGRFSGFLSTHPPTAERLAAARGAARDAGEVFGGDPNPWSWLQGICRKTQRAARPITIP